MARSRRRASPTSTPADLVTAESKESFAGTGRRSALVVLRPGASPELHPSLRELLARSGFDVAIAEDERGALELLGRRAFDVVLADLPLDGLDRFLAVRGSIGLLVATSLWFFEEAASIARHELASALTRAAALEVPRPATGGDALIVENLRRARMDFERHHVRRVLELHGGDKARAASALGTDVSSLYRKLHASEPVSDEA